MQGFQCIFFIYTFGVKVTDIVSLRQFNTYFGIKKYFNEINLDPDPNFYQNVALNAELLFCLKCPLNRPS